MKLARMVELAEAEVKQAETMVKHSQDNLDEWQEKLTLRKDTLRNLQAEQRVEVS